MRNNDGIRVQGLSNNYQLNMAHLLVASMISAQYSVQGLTNLNPWKLCSSFSTWKACCCTRPLSPIPANCWRRSEGGGTHIQRGQLRSTLQNIRKARRTPHQTRLSEFVEECTPGQDTETVFRLDTLTWRGLGTMWMWIFYSFSQKEIGSWRRAHRVAGTVAACPNTLNLFPFSNHLLHWHESCTMIGRPFLVTQSNAHYHDLIHLKSIVHDLIIHVQIIAPFSQSYPPKEYSLRPIILVPR